MTIHTYHLLSELYNQMDRAWDDVAAVYGFTCNGCEDNCCKSLFYHHTHIEKAYFLHGFNQLDTARQAKILSRAKAYCQKTFDNTRNIKSLKLMCPANEMGRCVLYPYRPMICRLHGLPHEIIRPGGDPVMGKGCPAGSFETVPYVPFDRTSFYQQMAHIEMTFRQQTCKTGKIKQTIAQMLVSQ